MDSYNFIYDTNTFTPTDIPHKYDDKYLDYLDKHYDEFDYCSSFIYMWKLINKYNANQIKEINNDVTRVNFNNNYSYSRKQMVVHIFDKIFQGILDADPSCTFPLSRYFLMDWHTGYFTKFTDAQEHIDSIEITPFPYIDLSTLFNMLRDCLVSSLTVKRLWYLQKRCELQFTHEEVKESNINTAKFTIPHKTNDKIVCIVLEHLFTTKNVIFRLYDLKSKIVPEDAF